MERPVKPTFEKYPIFEDYMSACGQWEHDIEEYCNYLEQSYKSMQATVNKLKKGIEEYDEKLQKIWIALDKACEIIYEIVDTCPYDHFNECMPSDCEGKCDIAIAPKCWKEYIRRGK